MSQIPIDEIYKNYHNIKEEDIKVLKDWVQKQPHFPTDILDIQLVVFYHSCYYNLEATKDTLENFFTIKTLMPEFSLVLTADELKFATSIV